MAFSGDYINLGNPTNERHDEEAPSVAKVTYADHPLRRGQPDSFAQPPRVRTRWPRALASLAQVPPGNVLAPPASKPPIAGLPVLAAAEAATVMQPGTAVIPPGILTPAVFDSHGETVRDSDIEMVGELASHRDPFSGGSGIHPLGVLIGTLVGGPALGTTFCWLGGIIGGPLPAAVGASVGCIVGCVAGGYAGKRVAEHVRPTTEDHYWRRHFASRPYVPKGASYQAFEPAYTYGIDVRERFLNLTWEEAETAIRTGWEQYPRGPDLTWERARWAIQDAWDHLTPEPGDEEASQEEKERDE